MTRGVLIDHMDLCYGRIELPPLGPDEVLLEPRRIGICRSDLELLEGSYDEEMDIPYPIVFGHEWAGVVAEVGRDVESVLPGDRVVGAAALGPGQWFGLTCNGAASEQFIAPARLLHHLPDSLSFEQGALVEPLACAFNGIRRAGGTDGGETVAILGGGVIGLCALALANATGARTVLVEPSAFRREFGVRLGATVTIDPLAEDAIGVIESSCGSPGADLVIEASGAPPALAAALALAKAGGRIVFMGICPTPMIPAPIRLIQAHDLRVCGATGAPADIWAPTLRLIDRHRLDLSPLVTAVMPLRDAADAFEQARDRSLNLKVQLEP